MNDVTNRFSPPTADIGQPTAAPLTWKQIYFSFEGRIPRKVFWLWGVLGATAFTLVLSALIGGVTAGIGNLGMLLFVPLYGLVAWSGLAVSVKRWHDRDKSGWWVLIGFIPVIGGIWALVENGFLRGTPGTNRFGPDITDAG